MTRFFKAPTNKKNVGFFFITLIITVLIAEIILRTYFPIRYADITSSYEYSGTLGYKFKKEIHNTESTDHYKEDITNNFGIIGIQNDYSDFNRIIYTIGDSFTKGTGAMFDSNYPFYLSLCLNQLTDTIINFKKDYGILNLGTPGYGLKQSLIRLEEIKRVSSSPDIICFMGSENDYNDDLLFQSGYKHKHIVDKNPYWGKWYKKPILLILKTQLGLRLKFLTSLIRQNRVLDRNENLNSLPNSEKMLGDIEKLITIARSNNAKVILSWSDANSNSYNWLKNYCALNKIPFADWARIVKKYKGEFSILNENNTHSGGHKRPWVNYMIALAFFEEIKKVDF